jgi:SAM-dependent methyltransferase
MLNDTVRVAAFERGMRKVIRGQETVLEIGTGTGILSLLAARLGAKAVVATEAADGMVLAARDSFTRNQQDKRIKLIPVDGDEPPPLPSNVDVIISECLGHFGFDEDIVRIVAEARHLLRAGGHFMPRTIQLFVAAVSASQLYGSLIDHWQQPKYGFDFSHTRDRAARQIYIGTFSPSEVLSDAVKIIDYRMGDPAMSIEGEAELAIKSQGTMHGLAGWFEAELAEGVWLSTSPFAPLTHWEQSFLPLAKPVAVAAPQRLAVSLKIRSLGHANRVEFGWALRQQGKTLSVTTTVV